jgi:hypothetical protein
MKGARSWLSCWVALLLVAGAVPALGQATAGWSDQQPGAEGAVTWNMRLIGQIGGVTQAVAVQESYAYVAEGGGLTVLDVSDPAAPAFLGKTLPLPNVVEGVAVLGSYAFVAGGDGGMRVVDVSDPARPAVVGACDTPGSAFAVAVCGDPSLPSGKLYAYVADGYPNGLRVVDVSDPAWPVEVGHWETYHNTRAVAIAGQLAYVAYEVVGKPRYAGLAVVDVSDPAQPVEVGSTSWPGLAGGVAVTGTFAYITDGWYTGLHVLDVSDPAQPVEVGQGDTAGGKGVAVSGDYAYLSAHEAGLVVVDVSDPAQPVEVGSYDTPGLAFAVAVRSYSALHQDSMSGAYAYVADKYGLRVVDVSDPAQPVESGFYSALGLAYGVAMVAHYAYVAGGESGCG